jgi:hypothetical protein
VRNDRNKKKNLDGTSSATEQSQSSQVLDSINSVTSAVLAGLDSSSPSNGEHADDSPSHKSSQNSIKSPMNFAEIKQETNNTPNGMSFYQSNNTNSFINDSGMAKNSTNNNYNNNQDTSGLFINNNSSMNNLSVGNTSEITGKMIDQPNVLIQTQQQPQPVFVLNSNPYQMESSQETIRLHENDTNVLPSDFYERITDDDIEIVGICKSLMDQTFHRETSYVMNSVLNFKHDFDEFTQNGIRKCIKFCMSLPGNNDLCTDDRAKLLKYGVYEIAVSSILLIIILSQLVCSISLEQIIQDFLILYLIID